MAAPRVSILIPAYHPRFFDEAFASARAQTHSSFEIVVCDDSRDRAIGERVRAANDSRVRYIHNPARLGFEANFTQCLGEARGELVKFLNDDDRLHPDCVERLSEAFEGQPATRLATSRRHVIDETGSVRADVAATSPVSYLTCVSSGVEMGNLSLLNGLNLVGEPSTVMFRRADVDVSRDGVFTWEARTYHCLADLSLWLRLLERGDAFYCASALSEYRMHAGQEQRSAGMGIGCIVERFALVQQAHRHGFVRERAQYRQALSRVDALAQAWAKRGEVTHQHRQTLAELSRSVVAAVASA
jgi:glycosyltransferase involved in cell wall biosynthesis